MGIDVEKQFSEQQTIRRLEDRHEGIMVEILRDDNDPAYESENYG